jgi:uncharacterized membrane protein
MRKGARLSLDHLAPITERSIMSKHDRKEPPLLRLVNHIKKHKTSISYYFYAVLLGCVFALPFAGVTI